VGGKPMVKKSGIVDLINQYLEGFIELESCLILEKIIGK
jgi:hypothetical protein